MSDQTPNSDKSKGKIIPFPVPCIPKPKDPNPAEDQEGNPLSEGKGQVLVLRKKRIRRITSIMPIPYSELFKKYLADMKKNPNKKK